jgi:hypothetical protein
MSTTPLDVLLQALRAAPGDAALQASVVQACIDAGDALAFERVFAEFGDALDLDGRILAHAIAFAGERHQQALLAHLVAGGDALRWLRVAREQLAEGDRDGARESYARAQRMDPSLQDVTLAGALAGGRADQT